MENIRLTIWKDRETGEVSIEAYKTKENAIQQAKSRIKEHCEDYNIKLEEKIAKKNENGEDFIIDFDNWYLRDGRHEKEIDVFSTTLYSN